MGARGAAARHSARKEAFDWIGCFHLYLQIVCTMIGDRRAAATKFVVYLIRRKVRLIHTVNGTFQRRRGRFPWIAGGRRFQARRDHAFS